MMTKLTETQALILRTASHRPDGLATPPESLPPAPRGAMAKALLGAGLVEVLRNTEGQDASLAWKLDGEAVFLRVTDVGLRATGVEAEAPVDTAQGAPLTAPDDGAPERAIAAAAPAQDAPAGPQEGTTAAEGEDAGTSPQEVPTAPQDGAEGACAAPDATAATRAPTGHTARATALRAAVLQVLAAWDDEAGNRASLPDAIAALSAALPARKARQPGAPRTPRTGTKQEAVLALLRRPEGASGPQMMEATGWLPHTVRGFLAGLKKRRIAVQVHDRVRQIGAGKEGAKGSYTVYRIAAEPAA